MTQILCRFCATPLEHVFSDLGMSPLANSYLRSDELGEMEAFYPLRAFVCAQCRLVQLSQFESPERIFSEYAYFSSYSSTWLAHSHTYADRAINRFALNGESQVIELASNDGYLLQYFRDRGIPVLGVEPAENVADAAREKDIPTVVEFFGQDLAHRLVADGHSPDLLIGNNVLAHVPDLHDFVAGMKTLLKPGGVITMEFPHLMRLVEEYQFDTIYHEHFSYFSYLAVTRIFGEHDLTLFDVEELPTHGGSLRIYARHSDDVSKPITEQAGELAERERGAGYEDLGLYMDFAHGVNEAKLQVLSFLIDQKRDGKRIVGYGAPAKGNTLLNFCGIGSDFIDFTVDMNPHKQGLYLPGSHIPIKAPEALAESKPDIVLILPWNIRDEIVDQHAYVREWGGRFAARTPELGFL